MTRRLLLARLLSVTAVIIVLLSASRAEAIPAFARRYETSCQTCHLAFPTLTPFGAAFRRNGYRFPAGGDETAEKAEPVKLGSDAQKDLWPNAVFPGELPGALPFSLRLDMTAVAGKYVNDPDPGTNGVVTDLGAIGGVADFVFGGSFGSIGGFFGNIAMDPTGVSVERGFAVFTPFDQTSFQAKVGAFDPSLHGISGQRDLLNDLRLNTVPVLNDSFTPEPSLRGVELAGIIGGRFGWFAGVVEDPAPVAEINKDSYARAEAKIGGMRLDGVDAGAASAAWREYSFTLGASVYNGRSSVALATPGVFIHDTFWRAGVDVHATIRDLLLDGVFALQRDDQPAAVNMPVTTNMQLVEATYVTLPWLFPTVRFERMQELDVGSQQRGAKWIVIGAINTVVRPNIVLLADAGVGADPGGSTDLRYVALNLRFSF
jgi:hypothetical protein